MHKLELDSKCLCQLNCTVLNAEPFIFLGFFEVGSTGAESFVRSERQQAVGDNAILVTVTL